MKNLKAISCLASFMVLLPTAAWAMPSGIERIAGVGAVILFLAGLSFLLTFCGQRALGRDGDWNIFPGIIGAFGLAMTLIGLGGYFDATWSSPDESWLAILGVAAMALFVFLIRLQPKAES